MDKHKTMRNHIAAAKGWLNQAEDSLEQENDIRGDLNLMLAQAELQRAQEKKSRRGWLCWLKRLLPLAAALCVAVGYVVYLRPAPQPAAPPVPVPMVHPAGEAAVNMGHDRPPEPAEDIRPVPVLHEPVAMPPVDERPVMPPRQEDGTAVLTEGGQPPVQEERPVRVPGTELQKLMQDAGSILRE
ncbi:hypothetical protein [Anaerovibrio sp.]|uniref:hypothetical protein n=1 Tax=Anaerovibrio sp. TaxID=1872532 RepID=UPI003F175706